MDLIPAKCPQCSADLQIPDDKEVFKCEYCNTNIFLSDINENRLSAINLIKLAKVAEKANNFSEAYGYYSKALEEDAMHSDAWFGKAVCLVKLAARENIRGEEIIAYFDEAVKLSGDENKNKMRWQASDMLSDKAVDLFYSRKNNYNDIDWIIYLFEAALRYTPYNIDIMKNLVNVCHDSQRVSLEEKIFIYEDKIKKADESYISVFDRVFESEQQEIELIRMNAIQENVQYENNKNALVGVLFLLGFLIFAMFLCSLLSSK